MSNAKERTYEGEIGGIKFRYSIHIPSRPEDEAFARYETERADQRVGTALLRDLIERGVVRVRESAWDTDF